MTDKPVLFANFETFIRSLQKKDLVVHQKLEYGQQKNSNNTPIMFLYRLAGSYSQLQKL